MAGPQDLSQAGPEPGGPGGEAGRQGSADRPGSASRPGSADQQGASRPVGAVFRSVARLLPGSQRALARLAGRGAALGVLAGLFWLGVWPVLTQGLGVTGLDDAHPTGLTQLALQIGLWVPLVLLYFWGMGRQEHPLEEGPRRKLLLFLETWCLALLALFALQLGHPERVWRVAADFAFLHRTQVASAPLGAFAFLAALLSLRVHRRKRLHMGKWGLLVASLLLFLFFQIGNKPSEVAASFTLIALAAACRPLVSGLVTGRAAYHRRSLLIFTLPLLLGLEGAVLSDWMVFPPLVALGLEIAARLRRSWALQAGTSVLWTGICLTILWGLVPGPGYAPTLAEAACALFVCLGAVVVWFWRVGRAGRESIFVSRGNF